MSLRTRISLAGGLVVFAALLIAAFVLYPVADRNAYDALDDSLVSNASTVQKLMQQYKEENGKGAGGGSAVGTGSGGTVGGGGGSGGSGSSAARGGTASPGSVLNVDGMLIQFLPASLDAGSATDFVPVSQQDVDVAADQAPAYFQTVVYQNREYRVYTAAYPDSGLLVRVARPQSDAVSSLRTLQLLLAALVLGGALAAAVAARLLAGRVLRPVRLLTDTVERVAATQDLSARMPIVGHDEIARLGRSFTVMMSALDESVTAQRRLVADASHELRTPLTSLTTNLELLAEEGGLADRQAPALLESAREQGFELKILINDLVDLARYGQAQGHTEDLRLDLLAAEVADRAAKRVPKLRFERDLQECFVHGDPDALERALANLVDNAVKWSPPDGRVHIRVTASADEAVFEVSDEGPGVSSEDLPHIFDRFYRSASARALPGSGLGLSIVRQVADTHGGSASAHQLPRGVRTRLALPRLG